MAEKVLERAEFLGRVSLLSKLSTPELTLLANGIVERRFAPCQTVFAEGQPCSSLFIIRDGTVKVAKYGSTGRALILRLEGSGALLGEIAAFDGQPYPATAESVDEAFLYEIPRPTILSFTRHHPDFAIYLCQIFASRLRSAYSVLQDFSMAPVDQRVATVLLKLCDGLAESTHQQMTLLCIRVTRQDLAEMSGCTKESVCRVTARFKREGLLKLSSGRIHIARNRLRAWLDGQIE